MNTGVLKRDLARREGDWLGSNSGLIAPSCAHRCTRSCRLHVWNRRRRPSPWSAGAGVPRVATVPTLTTRLCLSAASVSHSRGRRGNEGGSLRGELLGLGLKGPIRELDA